MILTKLCPLFSNKPCNHRIIHPDGALAQVAAILRKDESVKIHLPQIHQHAFWNSQSHHQFCLPYAKLIVVTWTFLNKMESKFRIHQMYVLLRATGKYFINPKRSMSILQLSLIHASFSFLFSFFRFGFKYIVFISVFFLVTATNLLEDVWCLDIVAMCLTCEINWQFRLDRLPLKQFPALKSSEIVGNQVCKLSTEDHLYFHSDPI